MIIAGVDAGLTNTGLVLLDEVFEPLSLNLIQVKPSAAKRLYDIELAVDSVIGNYKPEEILIFIEGYAYGAKYQRESLAELGGVLRRYFYLKSFTYWVIPPLLLKQYVTGSARANKNYMKKCTKDKWQLVFKSDDVCDAYGLARIGRHVDTKQYPKDSHEHKVIAEILNYPDNYRGVNTARRPPKKKNVTN